MCTNRTFMITLLLFLFSLANSVTATDKNISTYSSAELPNILITYNVTVAYYDDFKSLWEFQPSSHFIHKLYSEFESLSCDINQRLVFTHIAYIVQSSLTGQLYGEFAQNVEPGTIPPSGKSHLFITTPSTPFENEIFIVLSSVSPERTTIMKVDNALNVTLLYDSLTTSTLIDSGSICSVFGLQVLESMRIEMFERDSGQCAPFDSKRSFVMDLNSGEFELSKGRSWGDSLAPLR